LCQKDAHQNDSPLKGGTDMALLAVPGRNAFCADSSKASALNKKNTAVLSALQRIRSVEAKSGNASRLNSLDKRIAVLQMKK